MQHGERYNEIMGFNMLTLSNLSNTHLTSIRTLQYKHQQSLNIINPETVRRVSALCRAVQLGLGQLMGIH